MFFKNLALLFFISSCALFKSAPSLKEQSATVLLDKIQLLGEGRGRLTLNQSQYVFGIESVLKENTDWILAVTIPIHGEEAMIFPQLKDKNAPADAEVDSFEKRIQLEFLKLKIQVISSREFLAHMRSLIRFNLAKNWGQKRDCTEQQNELICKMDGDIFTVKLTDKELFITKSLGRGRSLVLEAQNLTESFFQNSSIRLYANDDDLAKKSSTVSLELFFQN